MIDFDEAVGVAGGQISKFVPGASNIILESALISDDEKRYEITFSYDLPSGLPARNPQDQNGLKILAELLGKRREYKVFLVDMDGKFKGFKRYKE